jgi:hypothetical protein
MSFPPRIAIALLVTAITGMVCFLGVRSELKSAENLSAEHRLTVSSDERRVDIPNP